MSENTLNVPDDKYRAPLVLRGARHSIDGVHLGPVAVVSGCLHLNGTIQGSLSIGVGASAMITGVQHGPVSLAEGALVIVTGAIEGSATVSPGAALKVEASGKLAGTLRNDGMVILRGAFGGARLGDGELRIEPGGRIKEVEIRNGQRVYDWSE